MNEEEWEEKQGESGATLRFEANKEAGSNCSEAIQAQQVAVQLDNVAGKEEYDLLQDLAHMKLNIRMGQLLALVPEYNAKLQKSFGREASVGAAVHPDSCLEEPCADWNGAVP